MRKPILSIIIPYYNLELWLLKRCIESISCQHLDKNDYEIILVDDGSEFSPQELLSTFTEENILYLYQENQGLSGARNSGLEASAGKYILFIDSDDYLYAETLKFCIDLLKVKEIDLLNFGFRTCYKKERELVRTKKILFSEVMSGAQYMYTHNTSGCAWLYIFRKEIATQNGLHFTPGIYHEDEEFTPRLYFFAQQIVTSNITMYAYYQRKDSIVNKKSASHLQKRFNDFKGVIRRLQKFKHEHSGTSNELQQKAIERKIQFLACDFIICMVKELCPYNYIRKELKELNSMNLYPLPTRQYSRKYTLFRILANNKAGIFLLYFIELFRAKIR